MSSNQLKITAVSLAILPVFAFAYTPGTYSEALPGQNGKVPVSVTFSKSKIEKVVIGEQKETVGIGQNAVRLLPERIIQAQSASIDGISGATVTSNAILEAVKSCIVQANGKVIAPTKSTTPTKIHNHVSLDTDLVIVGGGAAGMIAAIKASDQGLNVILLEKMEFLGGASAICGGSVVAEGSKAQRQLGVTTDSPSKLAYDLLHNGHQRNDLAGLTFYATNVGPSIDWAVNKGVQLDTAKGFAYRAEHKTPRAIALKGGCPQYAQTLRELVGKSSTKVLLNTKADSIRMQNGVAVGVTAVNINGTAYTINSKAVLLATGGYGYNKSMLVGKLKDALYYGPVSSTGDGHHMAEKAGAALQLMDLGKIYPQGIESAPGIARSTLQGNNAAYDVSGILVDANANRAVNEKGAGKDILAVLLKQPNATMYLVMDAKSFDGFRKLVKNNGITDADIEKYLASNGKTAPLFAHANTLREVAKIAGLNPENLVKTVRRYNGFVQAGKDEDFNRPAKFMKETISSKGPYYIVEQKPRFATTLGGVVVTTNLEVLDTNGKIIKNLYAAGEIANSVHGDDSAPGANVGWGITSGKAVSDVIVRAVHDK